MAFVADIHGNLRALEAVLDALREAGAGALYVAGDLVFGDGDPLGVWMRLQELNAKCVRGTSDLALAVLDPDKIVPRNDRERERKELFFRARTQLGELIVARLRRLPEALRIELPDATEILVVHGSPKNADECFSHDMSDVEMNALVVDDPADVVICGGGHIPFVRALDGVKIVCVGSVGEAPEGGVAHYTLITPAMPEPIIEQRWVTYSVDLAYAFKRQHLGFNGLLFDNVDFAFCSFDRCGSWCCSNHLYNFHVGVTGSYLTRSFGSRTCFDFNNGFWPVAVTQRTQNDLKLVVPDSAHELDLRK
jgi:predicted phosphodiesterase